MSDKVFRLMELTGCSSTGLDAAIKNAITSAASHGDLRWFEVTEIRGAIVDSQVSQWQVTLKVGASE